MDIILSPLSAEIFTLVTGLAYIVLEIRQKNAMWAVGVLTALFGMLSFFQERLFSSFLLNVYYLATAIWGLHVWRRDKAALAASRESGKEDIHLRRPGAAVLASSALLIAAGTAALWAVNLRIGDARPGLDAACVMLSVVATWWLAKSYPEQWLLWIAADLMTTVLCALQGSWALALLYAAYTAGAVYGYFHWKRRGTYL